MKTSEDLSNRFQEVFLNGKWIANTNWQTLLSDVTFEQATHQVADLNTIALLTFHVNYYVEGLVHFFENGELNIRDKYSFDMEKLSAAKDWDSLRTKLSDNAIQFAKLVDAMTDDKLQSVFVQEAYGTYARNIEAMIEHGYYHMGQVSLIKKMVQNK